MRLAWAALFFLCVGVMVWLHNKAYYGRFDGKEPVYLVVGMIVMAIPALWCAFKAIIGKESS